MADKTDPIYPSPEDKNKKFIPKNSRRLHPLIQITFILLLIILSIIILYYGKVLLRQLAIAAVLAMMLNPLMNRLVKIGIPKWLAITSLTLLLVIIGGIIIMLIGRQIGVISQDWREIQQKLLSVFTNLENFIQEKIHISPQDQTSRAINALPFEGFILNFVGSLTTILTDSFLVLIYMILMLMEREYFKNLIINLSNKKSRAGTARAIDECVKVSSRFLFGRLLIVAILIGIYFLGFWLGGVPYPFFLALLAGLLSIIPFLGNIIGGGIACLLAFVTGGWVSVLVVLGVIIIGQTLGDYILTPWLLGSAVRLNPFMTIVSVIAFTILWGPVGAIFALPLVAILRILLQNMESTKPYATFLVGGN